MKVGDLVRYAPRTHNLQHLVGVVVEIKESRNPDGYINFPRIRALWSPERPQGTAVWDWEDELEVISESR